MATTEKKKTTGSTAKSGKRSSGSTAKSSSARKSTKKAKSTAAAATVKEAPKPIRREVGAVVCLLIAGITALGYFGKHALFIDWIGILVKGLMGYAYWAFAPMLIVAAIVLFFHRGRPVRLRVWCCMLTPVIVGAIVHLFLARETYEWKFSMVKELWKSGGELKSGGVISGILSQGLIAVVSKIGAGIIFFLLLIVFIIILTRVTPSDILGWLRRPRPEYEPEPEKVKEKKEPVSVEAPQRPAKAEKLPAAQKPRPNIDISVDDVPEQSAEAVVPTQGRKKSFFNRKAAVPAPDALLSQNGAQEPAGTPAAPAAAVVTSVASLAKDVPCAVVATSR